MHILLIEDDPRLQRALKQILEENGFRIDAVGNGPDGLAWGSSDYYDAIICDVMLPGMSGLEVIAQLRRDHVSTPVLMLTALGEVADKVSGLDHGADAYMTKPFAPDELLAQLRAITRRQGQVVFERMDFADLSLNLNSGELSCKGETIHLSAKEFEICKLLMGKPEAVVSKEMLIEHAWDGCLDVDDNNVESYISFLRKKLRYLQSCARIETLRKLGYRLKAGDDA